MSGPLKPGSNFGLISGLIGLTLCLTQAVKGHVDSKNERERLQEAHEQKMHFLHEFHRQQLHAKDHEIQAREHKMSAREMERRAKEAEERAERMARAVMERRYGVSSGGKDGGENGNGKEEKESEVWRLMSEARRDQQDGSGDGGERPAAGVVKEMEKNRYS